MKIKNIQGNILVKGDLSEIIKKNDNLDESDFKGVDFRGLNLSKISFKNASFEDAEIRDIVINESQSKDLLLLFGVKMIS